jgi:hypothetical protein
VLVLVVRAGLLDQNGGAQTRLTGFVSRIYVIHVIVVVVLQPVLHVPLPVLLCVHGFVVITPSTFARERGGGGLWPREVAHVVGVDIDVVVVVVVRRRVVAYDHGDLRPLRDGRGAAAAGRPAGLLRHDERVLPGRAVHGLTGG